MQLTDRPLKLRCTEYRFSCTKEIVIASPPDVMLSCILNGLEFVQLEDQRGLRSWAFEPTLELNNANANNELDLLLDTLCQTWLNGSRRKANTERQQQFMDCIRSFMLNLVRTKVYDAGLAVGIASGKERLNIERRYRPDFMSVCYFRKALALLQDQGIVAQVAPGFQNGELAQVARYSLTDMGVDMLPISSIKMCEFKLGNPTESIILKDETKRLVNYNDTLETNAMRNALARINTVLCDTDIGFIGQPSRDISPDDSGRGRSTELYRVFNNGTFEHGGRYYGGWWQLADKQTRKRITINGLQTAEADFIGLHAAILFSEHGLAIPEDPYALVPGVRGNPTLRRHAKSTFVALLNAKSMRPEEPSDFDCSAHGMTSVEFRQLVIDAFPMLPDVFGSEVGLALQRKDSDIAERIMLHFVDQGVPILPIHDSFIVQWDLIDELEAVMKATFKDYFGQLPSVAVKSLEKQI